MLTIYRRHRRSCKQRTKGRKHRHCLCPIWVDGFLGGKEIRESLKLRDWQRAQEMIREWEAEDRRTRQTEQQITIKDAHRKFIADAEARKLNESTLYKYRLLFQEIDAFAETYKLQFLPQLDLDTLATFRATWTQGPRTSLKKLERLRAFMRFAEKRKWIGDNPAIDLKAPKVPNKPTMPFTREEMTRIVAALEPYGESAGKRNAQRLRAFLLLLRYSGLRIGDATQLEVSRLNGNKLLLHTQKTGVPVYCVLPDAVVEALEIAPRSSEQYFFWTGASTVRSAKGKWQRRLQRLFGFAKVPTGHPHRLRDTFAVELLLAGVPLDRVSILLGHSSIRITERHYAPWTRSRQEQIEADLRAAWSNDPLIKEVHAGYTARPAARTRVFSRRRIGRGGGDRSSRCGLEGYRIRLGASAQQGGAYSPLFEARRATSARRILRARQSQTDQDANRQRKEAAITQFSQHEQTELYFRVVALPWLSAEHRLTKNVIEAMATNQGAYRPQEQLVRQSDLTRGGGDWHKSHSCRAAHRSANRLGVIERGN